MAGFNGFIIEKAQNKVFKNVIQPKLQKGERVNIFFSTNYYSGVYYYLYQFNVLSELAKYPNVHIYISYTDTVSSTKERMHFTVQTAKKEAIETESILYEIKSVLLGLGIEENRLHLYKSSEIWHRYMSYTNQNVLNFYKGMSVFPLDNLKMSKDWADNWFVPKEAEINIAYGIQKHMDLLSTSVFHLLFPDEIEGKVDLVFVGSLGSRLLLEIRGRLIAEGLIEPNFPVVAIIRKIPMFGHTASIHKEFVSPNWDMTVEQIYNVIEKFSVSETQIKDLFSLFLNKFVENFVTVDENKNIKELEQAPDLSKTPIEIQRLILAHNLFNYLKQTRERAKPAEGKDLVYISRKKEIQDLGRLLKSEIALKVLLLANGEYSASEIARKINKHASNLNPIIKDLKRLNLIDINGKGKLQRKTNRLSIDIPLRGN